MPSATRPDSLVARTDPVASREEHHEVDWRQDEEKQRADRKLRELDLEPDTNPVAVHIFKTLQQEKQRLEEAKHIFKALDLNKEAQQQPKSFMRQPTQPKDRSNGKSQAIHLYFNNNSLSRAFPSSSANLSKLVFLDLSYRVQQFERSSSRVFVKDIQVEALLWFVLRHDAVRTNPGFFSSMSCSMEPLHGYAEGRQRRCSA